jgi:hypothetical protein
VRDQAARIVVANNGIRAAAVRIDYFDVNGVPIQQASIETCLCPGETRFFTLSKPVLDHLEVLRLQKPFLDVRVAARPAGGSIVGCTQCPTGQISDNPSAGSAGTLCPDQKDPDKPSVLATFEIVDPNTMRVRHVITPQVQTP